MGHCSNPCFRIRLYIRAITFSHITTMWLFFCYTPDVSVFYKMGKIEYFSKVIKVVTELMDVTDQEILGKSRVIDVVDARWMVIALMREKGYSTKEIAPLMLRPIRTINHALKGFYDRARYSHNGIGNIFFYARQQLKE